MEKVAKVEKVEREKVEAGSRNQAGGIHILFGEKERVLLTLKNLTDQSYQASLLVISLTLAERCLKHRNVEKEIAAIFMGCQ